MTRWQFGPYRVETLLGRGGMGEVYRAYDASQDRIVALKLLARQFAADEEYQERFRRESRAAARLRDPHVIPIHRYGEIDGRLFIDMRLVEGESLASVISRNGPLSPLRTLRIVEQVASALDAAHADGLIHRDVKPSNVLIAQIPSTGGNDFVYLVDFGICRALNRSPHISITEAGSLIGTPEYMAPERFTDGSINQQADVYALACLICECLTGQPPFPVDDLPALIYAHTNTPPPRPSTVRPELPESIDAVVAMGMAKDSAVRYSGAGELASAFRNALLPSTITDQPRTDTLASERSIPAASPLELNPAASASSWAAAASSPSTATPRRSVRTTMGAWRHEGLGKHRWIVRLTIVVLVLAVTGAILATVMWVPMPRGEFAIGGKASEPGAQTPSTTMPTVDSTINVGSKPEAVAITPDGKNAYVTNIDSKDLSVIDTSTNKITTTIPTQEGPPQYIAIAPDGNHAYVTIYDPHAGIHSVVVIDTATKNVTATIPVGMRPYGLTVAPDGSVVYVADHDSGTISVIATSNNNVVATIRVLPNPHWVAFYPDGRTAYVANHESNTMSVIDTATRTVTSVVPTGQSPHSVAVSPDGKQVDVVDYNANTVTVIDTSRRIVVATVPVGVNPRWIGYSPNGQSAYILNEGSGTLTIMDTRTNQVTGNVAVGRSPTVGAISPDGRRIYVVNQDSNTVSVVRLRS